MVPDLRIERCFDISKVVIFAEATVYVLIPVLSVSLMDTLGPPDTV